MYDFLFRVYNYISTLFLSLVWFKNFDEEKKIRNQKKFEIFKSKNSYIVWIN